MTSMRETLGGEIEIIAQDKMGRIQMPAERREKLLEEFERSGMSGQQYAAYIGVKYPTFANWRQNRERRKAWEKGEISEKKEKVQRKSLKWIEATIEGEMEEKRSVDSALIVKLPSGEKLEISSVKQVELAAELLKRLGNRGRMGC